MKVEQVSPYWKHLRVPYALSLAPVFLWGFFLAGGRVTLPAILTFVAFHLFLYPATTAYNSVFDQDVGPVGGMRNPPMVPSRLMEFALIVLLLGLTLVEPRVLPLYVGYAILGIAYSHPAIRFKAYPMASATAVALGQGALACIAGWVSGRGSDIGVLMLGATISSLTVFGLYPVGQVFQVEEDARRGDHTLAVVLGPAPALRLGAAVLLVAGFSAAFLMAWRYTGLDVVLIAVAFLIAAAQLLWFARRFESGQATVESAFVTSSRLTWLTSGAFLVFIAAHMWR